MPTRRRRRAPVRRRRRSTVARFLSTSPKRKKRVSGKRVTSRSKPVKLTLKSSVVKEIWGVIYLGVGILTILSIQESLGIVGEMWKGFLSPILGWGIYVIPVFFMAVAGMFFFSKKVVFGLERTFGGIFMMISILGILHLYVPVDNLYAVAQEGRYGGYVGFVTNFILRTLLNIGHLGTSIIFLMTFLISVLLTFEISLMQVFSILKPDIRLERRPVKRKAPRKTAKVAAAEADDFETDAVIEPSFEDQVIHIRRAQISSNNSDGAAAMAIPVETEKTDAKKQAKMEFEGEEKEKVDYSEWEFPSLDLLDVGKASKQVSDKVLKDNAEKIRTKLGQFGIEVAMHEVHVGPTVIQYTLKPDEGVKLSKILSLKNDLALALAAQSVRIEAPIPGKSLVGIEVPNDHRCTVHLREILESEEFQNIDSKLRIPMGRDVSGKPIIGDLASMPHLLIAGATGAGKSVGMNSFLLSLLYQNSPEHLKLIMIDPKRVELVPYNGIPHLLSPVITDPEKAGLALKWAVGEMNRRYQLCADAKHRNIIDYNADDSIEEKMCNIVIIIDELADLMMVAGKEVEASICRIAQMARAVGIHLVIATQRPSVNVITGLIKANIPARVAYAVSSSIDSRTILDGGGAEDLLGRGDMLYLASGTGKPVRVQGIYVSPNEIERVTNRVKITMPPDYDSSVISQQSMNMDVTAGVESSEPEDVLYVPALDVIRQHRKASASLLQRRLKIGYARAARLLDLLEEKGKIGPVNGAKPREIYVE